MAVRLIQERYQTFDLGLTKNRWAVATDGAESMTFMGEPHTAWGAAVLTLYLSMDGVTPVTNAATGSLISTGLSATVDCASVPFVVAQLSTVGTASTYANLIAEKSISQ